MKKVLSVQDKLQDMINKLELFLVDATQSGDLGKAAGHVNKALSKVESSINDLEQALEDYL
jgi:hypothetical protein